MRLDKEERQDDDIKKKDNYWKVKRISYTMTKEEDKDEEAG